MNGIDKQNDTIEKTIPVEWHSLNLSKFSILLTGASFLENLCTYPLLLMKTRQQIDKSPTPSIYRGNLTYMKSIMHTEGMRGLYRGFWMYSFIPLPKCTYFLTYHAMKNLLTNMNNGYDNSPSIFTSIIKYSTPMIAGLTAELVANIFFVPIELVVQRVQINRNQNAKQTISKIWREDGLKGYYRGYGATMLTFGVSSGVYWMAYEYSKLFLSSAFSSPPNQPFNQSPRSLDDEKHNDDVKQNKEENKNNNNNGDEERRTPRVVQFLSGFIAGVAAASISNPFDVVKTRLQTQSRSPSSSSVECPSISGESHYRNSFDGMKLVYRTEGMRGFSRGLLAKSMRSGPFAAAYSLLYEQVLLWSKMN